MVGTKDILSALLVIGLLLTAMPVQADGEQSLGVDPGEIEIPAYGETTASDGGHFTKNMGQWPSHVLFVADTPFGRAVLSADGVMYDVGTSVGGHRVKVAFSDATAVEPRGGDELPFPTSYFYGNDPDAWVSDAPSYREILYPDVWPGIDVRYYFLGKTLKYDVVVGPDADVDAVRFSVEGAESLDIAGDRLDIRLSAGQSLQDRDLYAHYDDGEVVDVDFAPSPYDGYGFRVDKEPGRTLVIDPVVVHSSSIIGGTYADIAVDMEVDSMGDIYIGGTTGSPDFPVTTGTYHGELNSGDVFVTKMSYNCSEIIWSTFLGGSYIDFMSGMELDDEGHVYLSGTTWAYDFPVTDNAFQQAFNRGQNNQQQDFWVTKLKPDGSRLVYSTYVGGSGPESGGKMAVQDGRAAVAGRTDSMDFPTNDGGFGANHGDAILFVLSANGSAMEDFMFWGGGGSEQANSVAFTEDGDLVAGGYTSSMGFPTTPGAFQQFKPSFSSGWVSRFSPETDRIVWSTFVGGSYESVMEIAVDQDDYVYFGGWSLWTSAVTSYPITEGAYDTEYNGRREGFVSKMDPNGTRLEYSTLLGGDGDDEVNDIEPLGDGTAVVVGGLADGGNYSVTPDALDPVSSGKSEGFVIILNENGTGAKYSSFLGGSFYDVVNAVEITPWDNLVLAGGTESNDFPITEGAYSDDLGGSTDAFVTIIGEPAPPGIPRDVVAQGGESHILIDWDEPEDDGGYAVRYYLVYRGTSPDNMTFFERVVGRTTVLVDASAEYGINYHYAVQADNFKGRSPMSDVASNLSFTFPDAPFNLTGSVGMDGLSLQWETPGFTGGIPLVGFRLYRGLSDDDMAPIATIGPDDLTYLDQDVTDRTTYVYRLATLNRFDESLTRPSVTLRAFGPPTQPLALEHTYGDLLIRLKWQPVGEDYDLPVEKYNVYRGAFDGPSELVGTVATRWYMDEDVEVGVIYYYRITAENPKGQGEPSEELEAMAMVPPGPPTDVLATAYETFVKITWTPPEFNGASLLLEYNLYTGVPGESTSIGVVSSGGVVLVFLHDVSYDGISRSYYVTAVNAEGESVPSPVAWTRAFEVPGAPLDLAIERGDGVLTLGWSAPDVNGGTEVISYILYRKAGDGEFSQLSVLPFGSSDHTDTDVENGVTYTYRITANNLVGESEPTIEVSAVPAGPPSPPSGLATEGSTGSVIIMWVAPAMTGGLPIDGYRVYGISQDMQIELLGEVGPDAREFIDDGLVNGNVYLYSIRSFTQVGESRPSDIVEGMPVGSPGEPAGLVALWMEDHVYVSWSQPMDDGGSPVTGYSLRRDDWEMGTWVQISLFNTTYLDTDVERGSTYNYTLRAHNGVNGSSIVTIGITVPMEEETPPETAGTDLWPLVILGLALVVAVAVALMGARRQRGGEDR